MSKLVNIETFRGYVNKILPTVYEDSLSYYEVLCKVLEKMNEIINLDNQQNEIINNIPQSVDEFAEQLAEFKRDMNTDFDNFTTQINNDMDAFEAEVNAKIAADNVPTQGSEKLVKSGGVYASLQDIIDSLVKDLVPTQDSSNYVTSGGVYAAIQTAVTNLNETIATKQNILTFDTTPTENSVNPVISGGIKTYVDNAVEDVNNALERYEETTDATLDIVTDDIVDLKNNKQNTLTFDSVPTSGSDNPVTSDGIYNAIQGVTPTIDIDGAPTEGSTNAVSSGGTYDALVALESDIDDKLDDKQDTLVFDVVPTQNSQNPVMSGGVWNAIAQIDPTGTIDPEPTQGSVAAVSSGGTWTALNTLESTLQGEIDGKQDTLTFDNAPTLNSGNPVTSDGIYAALQQKQSALTFDSAPTENSTNPVTSGGVYSALQNVTITTDAVPTENSTNPIQSGGVYTALAGKQDTLTIDSAPTQNSANPVQSGGVYTALANKQNVLTIDATPTQSSTNPVQSGGVYTALAGKQNTLTFDSTPTQGSQNPVTSDGIYQAIQGGGGGGSQDINVMINAVRASGAWGGTQTITMGDVTMHISPKQDLARFSHYWTGEGAVTYPYGFWQWITAVTNAGVYYNLVNNDGELDCIKVGDVALVAESGSWEYQSFSDDNVWAQIIGIDTYTGLGNNSSIGHHIDWRFCCPWNTYGGVNKVANNNAIFNNVANATGDGSETTFWWRDLTGNPWIADCESVTIDDVTVPDTDYTIDYSNGYIQFNSAPANGAAIVVTNKGSKCPWLTSDMYAMLNCVSVASPNSTTWSATSAYNSDYTSYDGMPASNCDSYYFSGAIIHKIIRTATRWESNNLTPNNNSWDEFNLNRFWLPTEKEYYGSSVWSVREANATSYHGYTDGCTTQYPLFTSLNERMYQLTGKNRMNIFLLDPSGLNTTAWCGLRVNGSPASFGATESNIYAPVCFRTGTTFTVNPYWD